jgi:uncharacterized membrane protein
MPMKIVRGLAVFLAIAAATNVATVAALPWLINAFVMHKIAEQAGGTNVALHAPRPDAAARGVVRPSPDMLYTACVFDVSERPLHVTGPVPDGYASASGFAADTSNFFALNDAAVLPGADGRKRLDVIVARAIPADVPPGTHVVIAPSDRGLILFRTLIADEATLAQLRGEIQARQECSPL